MQKNNDTFNIVQEKPSISARLVAGITFVVILAAFVLLWMSASGYINLTFWLGICGFKQRYGLPCPGCGWTHSAQMFVTGHFLMSFWIQPAACFFCLVAVITAIFALLYSVFGIVFFPLKRIFCSKGVSFILIACCCVILMGWLVTLIRAFLET